MVRGLERFKEHFKEFTGHYLLIGGTASDILMDAAGLEFRATKDLDIVLCLEVLDADFAEAFWKFIDDGDYKNRQCGTGKKVFYRFDQPEDESFPYMLELFSRKPDVLVLGDDCHLTPIPVLDDVSSLSAILLDDNYYDFLHQHRIEIEGIPIVSQECLIPLKARAWLDLSQRKENGEKVDSRDIKKHKNDIFRLYQILSPELRVRLPDNIQQDMERYLGALVAGADIDLKPFGLEGLVVDDVIRTLRQIYEM